LKGNFAVDKYTKECILRADRRPIPHNPEHAVKFYVTVIDRDTKDKEVLGVMEADSRQDLETELDTVGYPATDYRYKITPAGKNEVGSDQTGFGIRKKRYF